MTGKRNAPPGYVCWFDDPPFVGTRVTYWGNQVAELVSVEPYVRRDGGNSFLLRWKMPDGRIGISALKSKSFNWEAPK